MTLTTADYELLDALMQKADMDTIFERICGGERLTVMLREAKTPPWTVYALYFLCYERPGYRLIQHCSSLRQLRTTIEGFCS